MLARRINQACGTHLAPWEIDELPDTWLDAITAMTSELDDLRAGLAKVAEAQAAWRRHYETKR